ncbi:unnamed protein product [Mytilus coruscus]|uniref:Uncharacterized protein n=1 Tax=Mytilus coruscus TaxID=42192 RepID=A0A6J8DG02_MYTCO|nr:unnamed protein product [Mytilus coruscus]
MLTKSEAAYDAIFRTIEGTFDIPVKERTLEQNNAISTYYKRKDLYTIQGQPPRLYFDNKPVLKKDECPRLIKKQYTQEKMHWTEAMFHQLKNRFSGLSEKIDILTVAFNPPGDGNFAAISHQLQRLVIYRSAERLRREELQKTVHKFIELRRHRRRTRRQKRWTRYTGSGHDDTDDKHHNTDDGHKDTDDTDTDDKYDDTDDEHNITWYENYDTCDEHIITVDEHDITGNEHNITGDVHDITGDEHNITGDEHDITGDEHNITGDEHNITGDEHDITGDEHDATGDEHDITGDEHDLTGDEHDITGDEHNITGDEHMTGDEHDITGYEHDITGDEHNITGDEHNITCDEHDITGDVLVHHDTGVIYNEKPRHGIPISLRHQVECDFKREHYGLKSIFEAYGPLFAAGKHDRN